MVPRTGHAKKSVPRLGERRRRSLQSVKNLKKLRDSCALAGGLLVIIGIDEIVVPGVLAFANDRR